MPETRTCLRCFRSFESVPLTDYCPRCAAGLPECDTCGQAFDAPDA